MQRFVIVLCALACLFMSAGVALDVNIAQYGALTTRSGGADSGTVALATGVSTLAALGVALLLVGAAINVVRATHLHQWGWLILLLALLPASFYAFLRAGFEADILSGLVSLLAPVAYLLYSVTGWPRPRRRDQGA